MWLCRRAVETPQGRRRRSCLPASGQHGLPLYVVRSPLGASSVGRVLQPTTEERGWRVSRQAEARWVLGRGTEGSAATGRQQPCSRGGHGPRCWVAQQQCGGGQPARRASLTRCRGTPHCTGASTPMLSPGPRSRAPRRGGPASSQCGDGPQPATGLAPTLLNAAAARLGVLGSQPARGTRRRSMVRGLAQSKARV